MSTSLKAVPRYIIGVYKTARSALHNLLEKGMKYSRNMLSEALMTVS